MQPEVVHCGVHCLPVLTASSSTQTDNIDQRFTSEVVEWDDFSAGLHCPSPSSHGSDYDCDLDSLNTSSESIDSTCASQSTACTSRLGLVYTTQLQYLLRFCPSCGQPNLSERTQITNVGTMLKVMTECLVRLHIHMALAEDLECCSCWWRSGRKFCTFQCMSFIWVYLRSAVQDLLHHWPSSHVRVNVLSVPEQVYNTMHL